MAIWDEILERAKELEKFTVKVVPRKTTQPTTGYTGITKAQSKQVPSNTIKNIWSWVTGQREKSAKIEQEVASKWMGGKIIDPSGMVGLAGKSIAAVAKVLSKVSKVDDVVKGLVKEAIMSREGALKVATQIAKETKPAVIQTILQDAVNIERASGLAKVAAKADELALTAVTTRVSKATLLKRELAPFKEEAGLRTAWETRLKEVAKANELANEEFATLSAIPKANGVRAILEYQAGIPTPQTETIKKVFDNLFAEANKKGLEVGYTKNYLPQVYANNMEEIKTAVARFMGDNGVPGNIIGEYIDGGRLPAQYAHNLRINATFSRNRVLPDYATAQKYGLTPKYTHPGQLAAYYKNEIGKTVANQDFVQALEDTGTIRPVKQLGDRAVELPFTQDAYFSKPHIASALNRYFRDEENLGLGQVALKAGAWTSRKMQEIALSAGIPGTNVNFLQIGLVVGKELPAGEFGALTAAIRANSDYFTLGWFKTNKAFIDKMAEDGFNLSNRTGNWDSVYNKLTAKKGISWLGEKIDKGFDTLFSRKTFQSYMPMQTINVYKQTYLKAIDRGLKDAEARVLAGGTVKAWMGVAEDWGRSQGAQDAISSVFFAPRFRETLVNLFANTAKSFSTELLNPAFAKNRKFVLGNALAYGLYNAVNKKLNGEYMWENESGKEFDLKIPLGDGKEYMYVGFMPSVAAFPRNMISGAIALERGDMRISGQKFGSLLSMPIKVGAEVLNNTDYFGRPIWDEGATRTEILQTIGVYVGIRQNHPYVEALYDLAFPVEGQEKSWFQLVSTMMEMPFKFNSLEGVNRAEYYDALEVHYTARNKAKEVVQDLYDELQAMKADGREEEADGIYYSLSPEDKTLYDSIKQSEKTRATNTLKQKLYPLYLELQEMKKNGQEAEANAIYDDLTAEEKRVYQLVKRQFITYGTE